MKTEKYVLLKWKGSLDVNYPYVSVPEPCEDDPHWEKVAVGDKDFIQAMERMLVQDTRKEYDIEE